MIKNQVRKVEVPKVRRGPSTALAKRSEPKREAGPHNPPKVTSSPLWNIPKMLTRQDMRRC